MLEQLGLMQPLSLGWLHTGVEAVSKCTACTGVCNFSLCSAHMQPQVYNPFIPRSWSLPPASASSALLWIYKACVDSACIVGELQYSISCKRPGHLLIHCLSTAPCRLCLGTRSPLYPTVESFPSHDLPTCSATLWHGLSGARAFAQLGLGHVPRWLHETWQPLEQVSLCPASGARQHALLMSVQDSHCPPFSLSSPTSNKRARLLSVRPQDWGWNSSLSRAVLHLHFLSFPLSSPHRGTSPKLITYLLVLPCHKYIFCTALVVQEAFFQLVLVRMFPYVHAFFDVLWGD